jgi:hypothetical protein
MAGTLFWIDAIQVFIGARCGGPSTAARPHHSYGGGLGGAVASRCWRLVVVVTAGTMRVVVMVMAGCPLTMPFRLQRGRKGRPGPARPAPAVRCSAHLTALGRP